MSEQVRNLEPNALWNHFADLNAVPRASKKEERVIEFAKSFGESLGLPTIVDEVGNVIIRKPATAGMENRTTVVLQSHLDMVHQKNNDTHFDFDTEGIRMMVEGDWVRADGTTLGADNGIGVASIMALLASDSIPHPAIEALFTIDEETGMTGAQGLKGGLLSGGIMLNLDTEEDNELTIGCAGGIDVTARMTYGEENVPGGFAGLKITVKGLTGGHSGMDIHLGRGNANKLMNRVLYRMDEQFGVRVASIDGGGLRNAIPRESVAVVALPEDRKADFIAAVNHLADALKNEHSTTDPQLDVTCESIAAPAKVADAGFQSRFVNAMYGAWNGIYRMSPDIADLVQTSNNVARVELKNGAATVMCLTRSSVESEKMDLANALEATFRQIGADVNMDGSYPGWQPLPGSDIVKLMNELYVERFESRPHVNACHAGLECGILGTHYPDMQMISFGPNIRGAHSPDEKVQISSVQKFWGFLLETLERIPVKA
ncbi:MAG: aminoacyl-histidine dipeptidase [Flavobacteriales bacterium]|nr:aminoacyl-histidine dipeptidase [Flavobacteriales bacterium]